MIIAHHICASVWSLHWWGRRYPRPCAYEGAAIAARCRHGNRNLLLHRAKIGGLHNYRNNHRRFWPV